VPGLELDALYWVEPVPAIGRLAAIQKSQPTWMAGMEISGRVLAEVGLRPPILLPEAAIMIEITRR
jgi:alpha-galactosidase